MSILIVADSPGRLGNLLHSYFYLTAWSLHTGNAIYNPNFRTIAPHLSNPNSSTKLLFRPTVFPHNRSIPFLSNVTVHFHAYTFLAVNYLARLAHRFRLTSIISLFFFYHQRDDTSVQDISGHPLSTSTEPITIYTGWLFKSDQLYTQYRDILFLFYLPSCDVRHAATKLFLRASAEHSSSTVVAVHIRRGDYKTFNNGCYFYDLNVYKSAMSVICDHLRGDVTFLIFSDEPLSLSSFADFQVVISNNKPIIDMYAMSLCAGLVGPPSTFSSFAMKMWGNGNIEPLISANADISSRFISRLKELS